MATRKKNVTHVQDVQLDDEYEEIADQLEEPVISAVAESAITNSDWTVETIVRQIEKGNIDLNPQFQRRFAWTNQRRSQFIESLALRYPVPQIVLARDAENPSRFIVLDGKQRLMTLAQFFGLKKLGKVKLSLEPLKLEGLAIKKDWAGQTFSTLRKHRTWKSDVEALENATIRSVVIGAWGSEDFLYSIFIRLNQGSLPLSPQELRQALRHGEFTSYADQYSGESLGLRKLLGLSAPDFRMRDVELFIRYIAFRLRMSEYRGNMKKFLDDTCDSLNKDWQKKKSIVIKESKNFEAAISTAESVFGEGNAFRKFQSGKFEPRLNRAIFDIVAYAFGEEEVRAALLKPAVAKKFKEGFERLFGSAAFKTSIESTTKSMEATRTRFTKFLQLVEDVTKHKIEFNLEK